MAIAMSFLFGILSSCSENQTESKHDEIGESKEVAPRVVSDAFEHEKPLISILDFDNKKQLQWLSSEHTSTKSIVAANNEKLGVEFLATGNISKLRIEPEEPWDLSDHANYNLAFTAENNGKQSVHVYLSIENPDGEIQSRSISLPAAYFDTVYFPLDGVEADTDAGMWHDFSIISALNFFTIGILENKKLVLDNIRLRKNPPTDPDWMVRLIDRYGQNATRDTPLKVNSDEELKHAADRGLAARGCAAGSRPVLYP